MSTRDSVDVEERNRRDELNNGRVETTKKRVAHAIRLLAEPEYSLKDKIDETALPKVLTDIAHAVNLLEAGNEELEWACEWFDWDTGVCIEIDDAVACLGNVMANIVMSQDDTEELEEMYLNAEVKDAKAKLSKSLAALVRWHDDDVFVEEV